MSHLIIALTNEPINLKAQEKLVAESENGKICAVKDADKVTYNNKVFFRPYQRKGYLPAKLELDTEATEITFVDISGNMKFNNERFASISDIKVSPDQFAELLIKSGIAELADLKQINLIISDQDNQLYSFSQQLPEFLKKSLRSYNPLNSMVFYATVMPHELRYKISKASEIEINENDNVWQIQCLSNKEIEKIPHMLLWLAKDHVRQSQATNFLTYNNK